MTAEVARIAAECVGVRLRMVNRVVTSIFDQALRPFGIKLSQMNILVAVANRGSPRPGDVGRILQLDRSTVSRNVDRMRKQGWLRTLPGDDARSHMIEVTASGKRLIKRAYSAWETANAEANELLGQAAPAVNKVASEIWVHEGSDD